ncbi:hypothetical protein N9Y67_00470 [Pseudomonadota bacterium]|nr:hypothetical protein [Pseudomonadota bacterium]
MKSLLFESQPTTINLAITSEKLQSLMQEGKLSAADFYCLDPKSKKSVWGMLRSLAASVL